MENEEEGRRTGGSRIVGKDKKGIGKQIHKNTGKRRRRKTWNIKNREQEVTRVKLYIRKSITEKIKDRWNIRPIEETKKVNSHKSQFFPNIQFFAFPPASQVFKTLQTSDISFDLVCMSY